MTIETYTCLAVAVMLISILINIILLVRIDNLHKFIRFLKMSSAILYSELQTAKQQNTHEDDRNIPTDKDIRETNG